MLPPVVILCGGRGTRLQQRDADLPKPLAEIGDRPILRHVIEFYRDQGADAFVLCTGFRHELVAAFAAGTDWGTGVTVECVDTGLDTPTGGRLHRVRDRVGDGTFMATYADGLADIDLRGLLAHHHAHGRAATMTVVRPELPFGVAVLEGDRVTGFQEKPRSGHWINGGFFCFEPSVFDVLADDAVLEREPLERLAAADGLRALRHAGFWRCLDTAKDAARLNELWAAGEAPWAAPAAARSVD